MDRQTIDLGLILKSFSNMRFSMNEFNDRLQLQKFIYMLQTFDIYLGYDFSWYIRGPYCSNLASCGFNLKSIYHKIPEGKVKFEESVIQENFKRFQKFIDGREDDTQFLEIAASLHAIKNTHDLDRDNAIAELQDRKPKMFTNKECQEIWSELEKWNLI